MQHPGRGDPAASTLAATSATLLVKNYGEANVTTRACARVGYICASAIKRMHGNRLAAEL